MQFDNNELVSVIVPMYNVEKYIGKCLESILQQSYSNLEVICVDDASPDDCATACKEVAEKDDRVLLIEKEKNEGLAEARNTGLKSASGKYIMFIDSDDWIMEDMVEKLVLEQKKSGADIVQCGFVKVRNELLDVRLPADESEELLTGREAILRMYATPHIQPDVEFTIVCDKLYTKEILNGISFTRGKMFEDQFFTYRCFDRSKRIAVISRKGYCYRYNNNSITKSKYSIRFQDELDAHLEQIQYFRERDRELYHIVLKKLIPLCINHFHRARHYEDAEAKKKSKNICRKMALQYLKNPLVDRKDKRGLVLFLLSSEAYYYLSTQQLFINKY